MNNIKFKKGWKKGNTYWKHPNCVKNQFKKGHIGINKGKKGTLHSQRTKMKIGLISKRNWKKYRNKIISAQNRGKQNTDWRKQISVSVTKLWQNPIYRKHMIETHRRGTTRFWKRKEYREKVIKNSLRALRLRPTSFEKKIIDLCKKYNLPFRYIGNGQIIIAGKNPDFINTNGKKLLIETFCKFWHPKNYVVSRTSLFKNYGYGCLFLDDDDICNTQWETTCLTKIMKFIGRRENDRRYINKR